MLIHIDDASDERLNDYTSLTDVELRKSREADEGLYLAESPKVIRRAIAAGHRPRSFLVTEAWIDTLSDEIALFPDVPVYLANEATIETLTGFHLHRGAMVSMHRPAPRDPLEVMRDARTVVVLDGLADHTNVGAIFRSCASLGADAVLLSPSCADPLYRRAVRVSMGAVLQVPWARLPRWQEAGPMLREAGFHIAALGLNDDAVDLKDFCRDRPERLALVFGAEGPGLSRQALGASESVVTIPMDHGVDSLNVATAAAITLWAVRSAAGGEAGEPRAL